MAWSLHRLLKEVLPYVLLCLLLAALAGFTWLTRHPDAELLQRAETWPWVGPLASQFRQTYRPPTPPPVSDDDPADPVGPPIMLPATPVGETMWLLAGSVLRRSPDPQAEVIENITSVSRVIRLEQRDRWYRVFLRGREGWVYLENYATAGPPYGNAPEAPGPLPGRAPDPRELAAARGNLGAPERLTTFGPYTVYTDSRDDRLLAHLDNLARQLESVYVERYDRQPTGTAKTVVVLFERHEDYRNLRDQLEQLAGLPASGHHSRGLIALYVGDRTALGIGSTLIHELVHALNRRSLGPALPPWLDEGLADDLAAAKVDGEGRLVANALNGRVQPIDGQVTISGALGSLVNLRRAQRQRRMPPLRRLMTLDWEGFVRSDDISLHYDMSAFWIRFLMQGQNGRHHLAFRAFLDAVAAGEPISEETLLQHLGSDLSLLEAGFRTWLEYLAQQAQLPDADPFPHP